jgi:benzoyl-CoA reductase/2-hydroxyglutaryl-CoA dehydratase subunit BcrC/BadD/HgdB
MIRKMQYQISADLLGPLLYRTATAVDRARRRRREPDPIFGPRLQSEHKLRELLVAHYLSGRFADGAVPVAWVTSGAPVELLRPFDYHVVYPENHAALCGARKVAQPLQELAEQRGYARDLCGYARCDLGTVFGGKTPVGRVPRPDLLVACTNICQTVLFWYRVLAAHFRVPLVLVDTPFIYGEAQPHQIAYVAGQMKSLVDIASGVAGKKLDETRFVESLLLSQQSTTLWGECLAQSKNRPAPWSAFDQFIHMAPIVAMRGTEECNAYYRMLLDELRERAAHGVCSIRNERYRLLWDNLPVWYKMRGLGSKLAGRGFNLIVATYTNAWAETVALIGEDEIDPYAALAKAYIHVFVNRDLPDRLRVMATMAREYSCDGVVLHSNRSCKSYSLGQVDLQERVAAECGVKAVLVEADHLDSRSWAEGPIDTRLAAFMESFS